MPLHLADIDRALHETPPAIKWWDYASIYPLWGRGNNGSSRSVFLPTKLGVLDVKVYAPEALSLPAGEYFVVVPRRSSISWYPWMTVYKTGVVTLDARFRDNGIVLREQSRGGLEIFKGVLNAILPPEIRAKYKSSSYRRGFDLYLAQKRGGKFKKLESFTRCTRISFIDKNAIRAYVRDNEALHGLNREGVQEHLKEYLRLSSYNWRNNDFVSSVLREATR